MLTFTSGPFVVIVLVCHTNFCTLNFNSSSHYFWNDQIPYWFYLSHPL